MKDQVIISLITIVIPSITTIITSLIARKDNYMHNAKQSILQLIVEDKIRVMEGGIPENKQNILKEFDEYSKKGGNSYVHEKVEGYLKWYENIIKK
jgi:hypothetical protein